MTTNIVAGGIGDHLGILVDLGPSLSDHLKVVLEHLGYLGAKPLESRVSRAIWVHLGVLEQSWHPSANKTLLSVSDIKQPYKPKLQRIHKLPNGCY